MSRPPRRNRSRRQAMRISKSLARLDVSLDNNMPQSKTQIDASYYRRHHTKILRLRAKYRRKNRVRINMLQAANHAANYRRFITQPINRLTTLFKKAQKRAAKAGYAWELRVLYAVRANPPKRCACCRRVFDYSCGRGSGRNADRSPSFDRRDNRKGYMLQNTFVVCYRCNRIKA